ncbi:MAG: methyltransferase protein [Acidobacteria bacterium]|nr:methyltransferase protein [Acidobacteriota bacterium]
MSPDLVTLLCTVRDCRQPLASDERSYACWRGHSFDIARAGYVNLLQPQERRSKNPGDSAEAVAARRRFLDRGFADPLRARIVELVAPLAPKSILDSGCGEGYYLGALASATGAESHGIDISTAAIEAAAKRYRDCMWIVGNADRFLPYEEHSFDVVLSITGRMNVEELHRVVAPTGTMFVAVSAPEDLSELRGVANRDRVQRTIETFAQRFEFVEQTRVSTVVELDDESARDILVATYRPRDASARQVTLALDVLRFTPRSLSPSAV